MPTLREFEQTVQRDPAHNEAYLALRKAYRESGKLDKLVTLYEARAQAIDDAAKSSELFYLAAEVRMDHLDDASGAEADLAHAVDRDSNNIKATARLRRMYQQQGRTAEYMTLLEMEAGAIAKTREPARLADLEQEMAKLSAQHLARMERLASAPARHRQAEATPENLKLVESARKIYRALGDFGSVARLYDLELAFTTDAKRRADLLLGIGKVLGEKLGDLDGAAQRLNEVVRLRPRDDKALEALAGVYTNPKWIGADGHERAAAIYQQVARRRHEAGDTDNAIAALRKALTAVHGHAESSDLLEEVLYAAGRTSDLDRYYRQRAADSQSPEERMDFLFKRAQLAEGVLADPAEAVRVYEEIVSIEPAGGPASQRLAELYLAKQDYAKFAELRERQLKAAQDPQFRLQILTELAAVYRDRLGDADQCAVYLHGILQIDPQNADALAAYADHFRQRGDWQALVDLLEFSVEGARAAGVPGQDLLPRLEEVAVIAERNLGDSERALSAWQRLEEISPGYERAREAQKRILQKGKQWGRMVSVLEREAKGAADPAAKNDILRRLARTYIEKLSATDKALVVYREILASDPKDPVAARAMLEILEREERWDELAILLRQQLDGAVARQERVNLLRRLLQIYDEKLANLVEGSWAATEILKSTPGDRDALVRLEGILEKSDDKPRLVQTLEYHVRYAATVEEKVNLVHRMADLLQNHLGNFEGAAAQWEELLRLSPGDATALANLTSAYEHLERPEDLARVLELQVDLLVDDPATRADYLRRLAQLAMDVLQQAPRAQRAWEELVRMLPADREALAALGGIYARKGDFKTLVGVLGRQIPLASDPAHGVELALERARIFEENLRNRDEAVRALEQIISELDPRNAAAHERLRRLVEQAGDWPRVVKVAERQLLLTEDPTERAARALEIGMLWRDRLKDPRKAVTAFERTVELDPRNQDALYALAPLYLEAGDARRLVLTDEKILALVNDQGERRRLMFEVAEASLATLQDAGLAFEWYRRAYNENPDQDALGRLEALAEAHGLWEDLIAVYEGERARTIEPGSQMMVALKIANLCEEQLNDPARAFARLRDALTSDPSGETLLPELERLAGLTEDFAGLLDVYGRVGRGRPTAADRVELLRLRAELREQKMRDPGGALDEFLRSFALDPEREETRQEILRLAELTRRWEDALAVEAQLFGRAADVDARVEVACRAAALVEDKVQDRVRAFRAYLNAFRLQPNNDGVVANLWRLADLIGDYDVDAALKTLTTAPLGSEGDSGEKEEELLLEDAIEEAADVEDGEQHLDVDELEEVNESPAPGASPAGRGGAFVSAWEELAQAYEALPANDNATRQQYLRKVAEVWERGAKNVDKALATLEREFRLDIADRDARAELHRVGEAHGRWDAVCEILLRGLDGAPRADVVAINHEVAGIHEKLDQIDRAEERYLAILLAKGDDAPALDRLELMYREQERWADLASLLEKRTTGAVEALPPGADRRRKSLELADLYEKRLERPYEAIDTLEGYVDAADEDERGADDPDVVAKSCLAYEALSRLYSRVGMWSKAADALKSEIALGGPPGAVLELRRRVAEIQEKELGAPLDAIGSYEAILAADPKDGDALSALDRLLEAHGRWEELANIVERRSDLATGEERADLIRRRAKLLEERLGKPEAAAASLRGLGEDALRGDDTTAALLRNLRSAGLTHEALKLLEQRIDMLEEEGAAPAKIAAQHLDIAALKLDQLHDASGARAAIEAALKTAPGLPEALAARARLYLAQNDFGAYAKARLQEAEARKGAPEAAAAYLEAGRVFRDQLGDADEARACFARAVAEHPKDSEALRSLASLLASEGEIAEARALFERQFEVVESPAAQAAVLTDLARVMWEKPGDAPEAIRRLDEALELAPDHLPAVITMADIYYKEQMWEQAERRLNQALRRGKGQGPETARLYHRLAEVYEKLGRLDEGYKQLVEADRVTPGQLLIRLSLGENRFHAKRWREASQYLDGIADDPDAGQYPDEVATGLAHAAQAEIKLKHPERAVALYEAALRLYPEHRMSLRAMADLALERGETRETVQYLRKLGESSGDRAERAKLFEQLGDLLHGLAELFEARSAYEEAVSMLAAPTDAHIPLLGKTLALQRELGATKAAADTAQLLIDLEQDPKERALRRREAALLMLDQGEPAKAAEYLEKALVDSPSDEAVLETLCVAYDKAARRADVAPVLARLLPDLAPVAVDPKARELRASLWERLGELRKLDDEPGAIAALQRAVEVSPGRVSAREALAELYGDRIDYVEEAQDNHRRLVLADVTRADSLRALGNTYASQGRIDWARCCFDVLKLLGLAEGDDHGFLETHQSAAQKAEDPYAGTVEDADRARNLAHPEARLMAEMFAAIWEGVPGVGGASLDSFGVTAQDRVSPLSDITLGKVYGQVAKALANKRTILYISKDATYLDVGIVVPPPPAIVVGPRLGASDDVAELRFVIGRAVELTRPEYILAAGMPPKDFAQLFSSVLKAFHPRHAKWRTGEKDAATEQAARLKKALPYKVSKRLAELFSENETTPFSSARWRAVVMETGNRAGLLMCGDLATAARLVVQASLPNAPAQVTPEYLREQAGKEGPLKELLKYAISDEYFALRESIGTSVTKAVAA